MTIRGRLRFPLSLVLATILSVTVLATSSIILVVEWRIAQKLTGDLLNSRAIAVLDQLERGMRADLDPTVRLVDDLSADLADGTVRLDDEAMVRAWLMAAMAGKPHLSGISVTRADLVNFRVGRLSDGDVIFLKDNLAGRAPALERLTAMRGHQGTYWGELLFSPDLHQPVINARRALYQDGRIKAYLAVAVTAGQLSDLVAQVGRLSVETPFVLYGPDRVLAHASLRGMFPGLTAAEPLPPVNGVHDPVLAALDEARPVKGFDAAAQHGIEVRRIRSQQGALVMTRTLHDYGAVPWVIGAWVPGSFVDMQMAPLREGTLIGGAALLVSLLAAFVIARLMAWPIKAATASAAQISTLETGDMLPLRSSMIQELHEQARAFNALLATIRAFETYVPKSLVRRLIRTGSADVASRERDLTIMFTDIVGFTRAAESLPASRVAELLNRHFAMLDECIEGEGGTIDKYMGDGLLAFWGAPERLKHRARRACRAALAIEARLVAENEARRERGAPLIRVRIGVHCGPTVVGNIGAPSRLNYTVIGDTVNVAQRLESVGRDLPGWRAATIIVSDAIVRDAGPGFVFERLGQIAVRGRARPVTAFSLLAAAAGEGTGLEQPAGPRLDETGD